MSDPRESRAAKLAENRGPIPPSKLAHVVRRTSRFEEMRRWYQTFLGAEVVHANEMLAFLTYDDEHHRIALVAIPGLAERSPAAAGTEHIAFTHRDLGDLLATYVRLRREGILPYWCINHGVTTSMYYKDPDGNGIELQVDNFATADDANRWMRSGEFSSNPIGVVYDPDELVERYRSGEPMETLVRRPPLPEGATPFDMLRL